MSSTAPSLKLLLLPLHLTPHVVLRNQPPGAEQLHEHWQTRGVKREAISRFAGWNPAV